MAGNTLGRLFAVTTFGESHGPAIGCVIDGCPPGMALDVADIQPELDRRRPGTSRHVTQRQKPDAVEILSGVSPVIMNFMLEVPEASLEAREICSDSSAAGMMSSARLTR